MKFKQGQSLVEVVVALGAMSLLLVALLSLVSLSVKNSRLAKDRSQAVSLAQEGLELMRAYRDFSWLLFSGSVSVNAYNLPANWVVEDGLSEVCNSLSYDIVGSFSRCVALSLVDSTNVEVQVTVYWQEGSVQKSEPQTTRLSVWER